MNPKTFFKSTFALATILFVLATVAVVSALELGWFSILSTPECVLLFILVLVVYLAAGALIAASLYALHEDYAAYLDASLKGHTDSIIKHIGELSKSYSNRNTSILQEMQGFRDILQKSLDVMKSTFASYKEIHNTSNSVLINYVEQLEPVIEFAKLQQEDIALKRKDAELIHIKLTQDLELISEYKNAIKYINDSSSAIATEILSDKLSLIFEALIKQFEVSDITQVLLVLEAVSNAKASLKIHDAKGKVIAASKLNIDPNDSIDELHQLIKRLINKKERVYKSNEELNSDTDVKAADEDLKIHDAKSVDLSKANTIAEEPVEE